MGVAGNRRSLAESGSPFTYWTTRLTVRGSAGAGPSSASSPDHTIARQPRNRLVLLSFGVVEYIRAAYMFSVSLPLNLVTASDAIDNRYGGGILSNRLSE
eukprot:7016662-Pyramimonas_sp.AAC.2